MCDFVILYVDFLENIGEEAMKKEYLLPKIIDKLLSEDRAKVTLLETKDKWFGVTYKEDKAIVVNAICKLIAQGIYGDTLQLRCDSERSKQIVIVPKSKRGNCKFLIEGGETLLRICDRLKVINHTKQKTMMK